MPRYGPFIHQVYIADGFADDCDELIHRCLKAENFDFHVFCQIWKEMNMGCMYEGRTLGAEIAELSEELIHIGKHYMLKNTSNFEESVVGVFIVYALLHLQPYQGFAPLRIVLEDLPAINRIEHVARREKRYDVLYALASLLIKGPVQYHVAEKEYGMDLAVRKYLEGFTSIDKLGVRPKGVFRRQNEELDILRELSALGHKYAHAKMMISDKAQFDRNLRYANPDMPKELEEALMKLISGIHEEQYGAFIENKRDECEIASKSRKAIKDKAMKQEVKPVKHLVNLKNPKTSTSTSVSPKKEDVKDIPKSRAAKNRQDEPNSRAERKRRIPISPRALKHPNNKTKPKLDREESSEDESEGNVHPSKKTDDTFEIVAEKMEAVNIETKLRTGNRTVKNEDAHELDIEIDTLPVLIRTEERGKVFEIEIIDHQSPAKMTVEKTLRTYKKKESALKKISSMPGMSIEKIVQPAADPGPSTSFAYQPATIVEIDKDLKKTEVKVPIDVHGLGIPNAKIEKRDCKRVHLQSKLKRLGMLPIANFIVPEDMAVEESNENDTDDDSLKSAEMPTVE